MGTAGLLMGSFNDQTDYRCGKCLWTLGDLFYKYARLKGAIKIMWPNFLQCLPWAS